MPRMHLYVLAATFIIALLLPLNLTSIEAEAVSFTVTELSVESDLYSVAIFKGGVISVGKSGIVALAYMDGEKLVERPVDGNLLSVSCAGSKCLAVGERGIAVVIDVYKKTFKPTKISDEDLKEVEAYAGRFYITASKRMIIYSPEMGVSTIFNVGAIDVLPADRLYILVKDRILYLEGEDLGELAKASYDRLAWIDRVLYGLSKNGLYRVFDSMKVLDGSYERVASCDALYLSSGSTVYRFDGERVETQAVLLFKPRDIACRAGEVYAVGEKGYYARVSRNNVELLFAPSGRYLTVSADSGVAYIAGDKVLSYSNGIFRLIETPSTNYVASSTYRGAAALLSQSRIVLVSDAGVKMLPYMVGGYSDIWFSGERILLAGKKGLVEVSVNEMASGEVIGGVELYAVNGYGAAGKSTLAVFSSQSTETIKVNGTLRGLDGIPCGLVAVGDVGLVAYRDGKISYHRVPGGEKLKSVAVKLDGAYALVGGVDGGLYIWDGYKIRQLPYNAHGEVTDIAWLSDNEALITAGGRLLLYRDLGRERPSLNIQAPEILKLYNGTERVVDVTLNPLNGFSGELVVSVSSEGLEGLWAEAIRGKVYVKPMCPIQAEFRVSASPDARGTGKLFITVGGEEVAVNVVVEPKTRRVGEESGSILEDPVTMAVIMSSAILIGTFYVIFRVFKSVKKTSKSREGSSGKGRRDW